MQSPMFDVVTRAELGVSHEGPSTGWAHIGFEDHPSDAPNALEFGPLLLVADGVIPAGTGFPMHRHEGVEILMLMCSGELQHADALGGQATLGPGELMLMSAGSGTEHAEYAHGNAGARSIVIWLKSDRPDAAPAIFLRDISKQRHQNVLVPLADAADGSDAPTSALPLRCDARILAATLDAGARVEHEVRPSRAAYVLAQNGAIWVNGVHVEEGARVLARRPGRLQIEADRDAPAGAEVVLIDVHG